jgi:hypothetical protein
MRFDFDFQQANDYHIFVKKSFRFLDNQKIKKLKKYFKAKEDQNIMRLGRNVKDSRTLRRYALDLWGAVGGWL